VLNDKDPNTRLAAILSLVEIAPSESLGQALYKLSLDESVKSDEWLSKAVFAAAGQHKKGFIDAFLAANPTYDPSRSKEKARESIYIDDSSWKSMKVAQYMEKAGLNIDGVVWFRKVIELPASASGKKASISLGPINDSDITFINGVRIGATDRKPNEKRNYEIAAGLLKAGKNIVAVRVEDLGGNGGIYGTPEELFLNAGGKKISLAGDWKYDVEKESGTHQSLFTDISIGELFTNTFLNQIESAETSATSANGSVTVIKIKVIKNEMKYDLKSFTVEAGKEVEIIFENPDFMQHNLVIAQIGALETVGKAADKIASDPKGAEKQYVPEVPEVLFATKLVNPQQTVKLNFIAPKKEGDYPFVCTFPGHWSLMNGTMKVVTAKSPL